MHDEADPYSGSQQVGAGPFDERAERPACGGDERLLRTLAPDRRHLGLCRWTRSVVESFGVSTAPSASRLAWSTTRWPSSGAGSQRSRGTASDGGCTSMPTATWSESRRIHRANGDRLPRARGRLGCGCSGGRRLPPQRRAAEVPTGYERYLSSWPPWLPSLYCALFWGTRTCPVKNVSNSSDRAIRWRRNGSAQRGGNST